MTRWAAFVGLTVVLTALLLALARFSQGVVDDRGTGGPDSRALSTATRRPPAGGDPVLPRFEPPAEFRRRGRQHPGGGPAGEADLPELTTGALLANVAITQGLFGGLLAGAAWYFQVPGDVLGLGDTPLAAGLPGLAVGVGFGVALWLANEAAGVLADAAGAGYDEGLRELLAPDSLLGWVVLLGGVLPVVAVVEEFVFRAAAVGAFSEALGTNPWLLAVVSSLAFGVAHGAQGRTGMLVTGGLGFVLAAGFVLTESLLVVAVAHYLVNALEMLVHEGLGVDRPA